MLLAGAEMIAMCLRAYGEDETADWVLECSEDELVKTCSVGGWLVRHAPHDADDDELPMGVAAALAAVYVREGRPRELARSTAIPGAPAPEPWTWSRQPSFEAMTMVPSDYGVGRDLREYWEVPEAP